MFGDQTSTSSNPNTTVNLDRYSLDYILTRKRFKQHIKRMSETESQMWFDHLEQEISDYKEIKEIYEMLKANPEPGRMNAEMYLKQQHAYFEQMKDEDISKLSDKQKA